MGTVPRLNSLKWPILTHKQQLVESFSSALIVEALGGKDCGVHIPAETSHLFWSLENHFILINQETSIEKVGGTLLQTKVISINYTPDNYYSFWLLCINMYLHGGFTETDKTTVRKTEKWLTNHKSIIDLSKTAWHKTKLRCSSLGLIWAYKY